LPASVKNMHRYQREGMGMVVVENVTDSLKAMSSGLVARMTREPIAPVLHKVFPVGARVTDVKTDGTRRSSPGGGLVPVLALLVRSHVWITSPVFSDSLPNCVH